MVRLSGKTSHCQTPRAVRIRVSLGGPDTRSFSSHRVVQQNNVVGNFVLGVSCLPTEAVPGLTRNFEVAALGPWPALQLPASLLKKRAISLPPHWLLEGRPLNANTPSTDDTRNATRTNLGARTDWDSLVEPAEGSKDARPVRCNALPSG